VVEWVDWLTFNRNGIIGFIWHDAIRLFRPTGTQANDVTLLFLFLFFVWFLPCYLIYAIFFRKKDKQQEQLRKKVKLEGTQSAVNNPNSSLWIIGIVFFIGGGLIIFTNILLALFTPHEITLCGRFSGCTTYDMHNHPIGFFFGTLEWLFF
jgi:hypothetical protein